MQPHNEEQNPPKDPKIPGQLKKITLIFLKYCILEELKNPHFPFWHS